MKSLFAFRLTILFVCSAIVAACGGGGGGDSPAPQPQPTPPVTYTIGGALTGLASGASVVLQNNGGSNLTVSANGNFTFATAINSGTAYAVTVLTQPTGQSCQVTSGAGTATANVTNVAVACTTTAPNTFTIGGTVSGLATGASLALKNNAGPDLPVPANGNFTFPAAVASGGAYAVTVSTQPAGQTCQVTNGTGTATANVTNVTVACTTTAPNTFTIGGTVSGLATGGSLALKNNADPDLLVTTNGNFTFPAAVASGAAYAVTISTQPAGQDCAVASGTGNASANVTNVAVTCTTTVSGTVSGLIGTVVLRNNGANDKPISADGAFSFGPQAGGTPYAVTVATQPTNPAQTCTVNNGSGNIGSTVLNITVVCVSTDQTPPTVTARAPMPFAVGSKIKGGVVFVEFSEAIDTGSVNTSSFKVEDSSGAAVSGQITFATNDTQAIFTPGSVAVPAALAYDTTYKVTLTTAVRDPSHNALAANVVWTFNSGKKLAMGFHHTCARMDDGGVKCWGANEYGQLGYDDTQNRGDLFGPHMDTLARVNLGTLRTAVAIAAGDYFTCARLDDGGTKCWGRNVDGQLGQGRDGSNPNFGDQPGEMAGLAAIDFGGGHSALEIAAGEDFACARLDNDTVKCWGLNDSGQLGQDNTLLLGNTTGDIAAAPAIALGTGLLPRGLALGHYHACALLQDGAAANHVKCWGDNRWGQLGNGHHGAGANVGDSTNGMVNASDVNLGTNRTATFVAANGGHTCALLDNASVKCWGLNTWAQVGLNVTNAPADQLVCTAANDCIGDGPGEMGDTLTPAVAAGVSRLTAGSRHNCVLLTTGQLKCWGSNQQGQLGLGDNVGLKQMIGDDAGEIAALAATALKAPVEEATAGGFQTCVWNTDDTLNCWGANDGGQLGHNDVTQWGDQANQMGPSLPNTDLGT